MCESVMRELTGRIVGYDPGGNGTHGIASLVIRHGHPENLNLAHPHQVQNAQAVLNWFTQDTTPILGIGVDTLTLLSTGDSGWRPADRWLRDHYHDVQGSVIAPNSLRAMPINGLAVISRLRKVYPDILTSETHPKVLYHHLSVGNQYDYARNNRVMNSQLAEWIGLPVNTEDDHQWDAVVSCLAVSRGILGQWLGDLHCQLPAAPDETLIQIIGTTHYYWPEMPSRVP